MTPTGESNRLAIYTAMASAGFMIAHQVGAKATRDALFLSHFPVTSLPMMVVASAVGSVFVVLAFSRAFATRTPARVMPVAFGASAVLLIAEWLLSGPYPKVVAVAVYLHIATLGAVLISGFWSVVNERFDPRTARKQISRISSAATLGGLIGGILAERVAAGLGVAIMLPLLAVFHLACTWSVRALVKGAPDEVHRRPGETAASAERADGGLFSGVAILGRTPYLRNLALLVLVITVSEVFIDYVFKAAAAATYTGGQNLMRFFALFYTVMSLATFVVQTLLTQRALDRFGLAGTVISQPLTVAVGGIGAALLPGLGSATLLRGAQSVVQSSLFRSGYELFYTPIAASEKRASKTIVDVGFGRLGDALGGVLVTVILLLGALANSVLLIGAAALAIVAALIARLLQRGYVKSLERSLLTRAVELDVADVKDTTTRTAVLKTLGGVDIREALKQVRMSATATRLGAPPSFAGPASVGRDTVPSSTHALILDPLVAEIVELRSGDPARIRRALAGSTSLDPALVAHVIPLLAMDEVATEAIRALNSVARKVVGQLIDALLDPAEEFAVRRRTPRVLRRCKGSRVIEGLLSALHDKRFEVRFQSARALALERADDLELRIDRDRVYAAVLREVSLGKRVWESQRLLDGMDEQEDSSPFLDKFLRDRASRSLEHVFTLLSLVLPLQPLQVAFRGLHTDDVKLRGTALEYLETILPDKIRDALWHFLEEDRSKSPRTARSRDAILDELMRSNRSIELSLAELRKRYADKRGATTGDDVPDGSD